MEAPTFNHQRLHGRALSYADLVKSLLHARRGDSGPTAIKAATPLYDTIQDFFARQGHPERRNFLGAEVEWADIPRDEVWLVNKDHPTNENMNLVLCIDPEAIHDQFLRECCYRESKV